MPTAGIIRVNLSASTAQFLVDMDKSNAKLREFGATVKQSGQHTVSSMQASSAAIRLFEGDITHNVRAIERLVGMFPVLSTAIKAAFVPVAVAAFAGLLGSMTAKVVEFVKAWEAAPGKIAEAFQSLALPIEKSNDELAVSTDRINNEIAKLEKRPINGLALALDEARLAADNLAESLDKDLKRIEEVVEKNKLGGLRSFLGSMIGEASTSDLDAEIKKFRARVAEISAHNVTPVNQSIGGVNLFSDEAGKAIANANQMKTAASLTEAYRDELVKLNHELAIAQKGPALGFENIDRLKGTIAALRAEYESIVEQGKNTAAKEAQATAEQNAERDRKAKEAAAKRLAQLRKEEEDIKKDFDEALAYQKINHDVSVEEEIQFWTARVAQVDTLGGRYIELHKKITETLGTLYQQKRKQDEADLKWAEEYSTRMERMAAELTDFQYRMAKAAAEGIAKSNKENAEEGKSIYEPRPDIPQIPITVPIEQRLAGTPVGAAMDLAKSGGATTQQMQAQIGQQQQLLGLMQQTNAPLGEQLDQRRRILEMQQELAAAEGRDTGQLQIQLAALKAQQTLRNWKQQGIGSIVGAGAGALEQLPGRLGDSISNSIFNRQKGESVGEGIEKSMKNLGLHMLGSIMTQMIEKMIATTIAQFGLNMLNNWAIHYASNPFGIFASGGRPTPGVPYIVGDRGPEIRIDDGPGTIIPNSGIGSYLPSGISAAPIYPTGGGAASLALMGNRSTSGHTFNSTFHIYETQSAQETGRHITNLMKQMIPSAAVYASN